MSFRRPRSGRPKPGERPPEARLRPARALRATIRRGSTDFEQLSCSQATSWENKHLHFVSHGLVHAQTRCIISYLKLDRRVMAARSSVAQVWRKRTGGAPPQGSRQQAGEVRAGQLQLQQGAEPRAGSSVADPMRELCRLYDVVRTQDGLGQRLSIHLATPVHIQRSTNSSLFTSHLLNVSAPSLLDKVRVDPAAEEAAQMRRRERDQRKQHALVRCVNGKISRHSSAAPLMTTPSLSWVIHSFQSPHRLSTTSRDASLARHPPHPLPRLCSLPTSVSSSPAITSPWFARCSSPPE